MLLGLFGKKNLFDILENKNENDNALLPENPNPI
jgi:hypothetical protein